MSSRTSLVGSQRSGPVATLVLCRPERHNSLVPQLLEELLDGLERIDDDESVRVVVLAAEGRSFSTGGDVKAFFASGERLPEYAAETVGLLNSVILAMLRLREPIVAAVHGIVTGGSLGLLLGADIVLMAPQATITPWYSELGYSPDGGWTALLPELIGQKRVGSILLSNHSITAAEAVAWGIATEVVAAAEIRERAGLVASEIAERKTRAVSSGKALLNAVVDDIAIRLEEERRVFVEQITTVEAMKGMAAFLRRPR